MTRRVHATIARRAFTLTELLVVIAILVVLVGVGGYYLLPRVDEAKEKAARSQVKGPLTSACNTYKLNNGEYPPTLEALTHEQPNGGAPILKADALRDPWDQFYRYDPNGPNNRGLEPDIWCERAGRQIGNWSTSR